MRPESAGSIAFMRLKHESVRWRACRIQTRCSCSMPALAGRQESAAAGGEWLPARGRASKRLMHVRPDAPAAGEEPPRRLGGYQRQRGAPVQAHTERSERREGGHACGARVGRLGRAVQAHAPHDERREDGHACAHRHDDGYAHIAAICTGGASLAGHGGVWVAWLRVNAGLRVAAVRGIGGSVQSSSGAPCRPANLRIDGSVRAWRLL